MFLVLCWSLVNSVPEVFVGRGPLNVTQLALVFRDAARGASARLPEGLSSWDLLALRFNAEYLLRVLRHM